MEIVKNAMFSKVYEADCFQKEFKEMTKEKFTESPPFLRYQKWLIGSLTVLEEHGLEVLKLKGFEQLENVKPNIYIVSVIHIAK